MSPGHKCKIFEVEISYNGRTYKEGKKIGWQDGFRAGRNSWLWAYMQMTRDLSSPTPESRNVRWFVLLWLGLAALFVGSHFSFFFLDGNTELGDWAANALQIQDAKYFEELYGNYSRWGFHHPGPAFFYVYAIGEWILRDFLRVVPAPHNAHAITGILLQTGFFAWTLFILHRTIRHRLFVPLVLFFASLHFGAVNYNLPDSAFESIWPPHVLLAPFLCFVVACAAMSAGSSKAILPAVIAGCFLVHGHVAQPLFVGPLFIMAMAVFAYSRRASSPSEIATIRESPWPYVLAAIITGIFLLPIATDALRGEDSNLQAILTHFSRHPGDSKTFLQSVTYLGSFLGYAGQPETFCDVLSAASLQFFADRWGFVAAWVGIATGIALFSRGLWRHSGLARWLGFYLLFALGLTICWGMLQTGPLYNFNSHFNFGLLFIAPILLVMGVCQRIPARFVTPVSFGCWLFAVPLMWGATRSWNFDKQLVNVSPNLTKVSGLREAAMKQSNPKKFLIFNHPDWAFVAGIAVDLKRLGFDYAVTSDEALIFGRDHVMELTTAIREHMPLWKFGAREEDAPGFSSPGNLFVTFLPLSLDPSGTEIRFSGDNPNASRYAMFGWDITTGPFSWSNARSAMLYFRTTPASGDTEVALDCFPFTSPNLPTQRMTIKFNELTVQEVNTSKEGVLTFKISMADWNRTSEGVLSFTFPDAASPLSLGYSGDSRVLGYGFKSLRCQRASQP